MYSRAKVNDRLSAQGSMKRPVLMEKFIISMNMDIWVVGTLTRLFIRGSYSEIKFSKK